MTSAGGEAAAELLQHARSMGTVTAVDLLAAQVVQGLGSDHGAFDLASVEAFATATPTRG